MPWDSPMSVGVSCSAVPPYSLLSIPRPLQQRGSFRNRENLNTSRTILNSVLSKLFWSQFQNTAPCEILWGKLFQSNPGQQVLQDRTRLLRSSLENSRLAQNKCLYKEKHLKAELWNLNTLYEMPHYISPSFVNITLHWFCYTDFCL